jgi:hypothetical protein
MSNDDTTSNHSNDTASNSDGPELKRYIEDIFISFSRLTDSKFAEFDKKLESLEKQIATLVVGFGEQAVFLEALLAQLSFASDEEQKAFQQNVATARREMFKVMKDGSETLVAREDERLASAITDVVDSKSSDL